MARHNNVQSQDTFRIANGMWRADGAPPGRMREYLQRAGGEAELVMAQRHVREAEYHVTRQSALIMELQQRRHTEMAAMARELLVTMEAYLALAIAHRDRIEHRNE